MSSAAPARAGRPARRKPSLVLVIPSRTEFLGLVRELAQRMAELAGFDPVMAKGLALAVDEATTNILEHAYADARDRQVELHFEDRGAELRVDLLDTGERVDPRAVPRVDLPRFVSERRTGGLGVHLMGKIMDSVTYRRSARRNVCTLVKRKDQTARAPGADDRPLAPQGDAPGEP